MKKTIWTTSPVWLCALLFGVALSAAATEASQASKSLAAESSQAALEAYRLLALSPSQGLAVLRTPDARRLTLRLGDAIPGTTFKLVAVATDRLRFDASPHVTTWMIRPAAADQQPVVHSLTRVPPPPTRAVPKALTTALPKSGPLIPSNR
jgi:hypothetical protein